MSNINSQVMKITPEKAAEILKGNTINRPKSGDYINGIAEQMKAGNWMLTGEAIIISKEGILLDGQHRLEGVVKANVPIEFYVIRGIEKNSFRYIDTGKNRSAGDLLFIEGIPNGNRLVGIAKSIMAYENNAIGLTGSGNSVSSKSKVQLKMTNADVLDYVKSNQKLVSECVKVASVCYDKFNSLSTTDYGLLYYIFGNIDTESAHAFLTKLSSGSHLEDSSAILNLRNKFIEAKVHRRPFAPKVKLGMIFKCWNLFRQGRVKGQIYFDISSPLPALI